MPVTGFAAGSITFSRASGCSRILSGSLSGNRLILGSPYYVDYDTFEFHTDGWAEFYSLPAN